MARYLVEVILRRIERPGRGFMQPDVVEVTRGTAIFSAEDDVEAFPAAAVRAAAFLDRDREPRTASDRAAEVWRFDDDDPPPVA